MALLPNIHFDISERKVLLRVFDILSALGVLQLMALFFDFDYFRVSTENKEWIIVFVIYLSVFGTVFELYTLPQTIKFQTVLKNTILTASVTVLFYLLTPFYTPLLPDNRLQIIYFFLGTTGGILIWRWLYNSLISTPRFYKRILVVGDSFDIKKIIINLEKADPNYKVAGYINTEPMTIEDVISTKAKRYPPENLSQTILEGAISEIVVTSNYTDGVSQPLYEQMIHLLEAGFPIREYMQVYEDLTQRVPVQYVDKNFYRYFPFSRSNKNKFYILVHRLFDILMSIVGLIFLVVILPLVFLGNVVANRGPIFYTQKRVGKNGNTFNILKLRTMVTDAESDGAQWAQKNDSRVTTFGKFLRKSRLDEIPQFYNVFLGEMSVIGPRPERPIFVEELSEEIPFYETRHIIKPGLTGWAQVMGTYASSEEGALEKLQYDLYYIKHRNIFMDLSIMLKTISTIIFYRGQ